MFKRIEKKLARKEKEEGLGLTEEIKEAIGLNDIDSDDSSSDESEASSSTLTPQIPSKRKKLLSDTLDASSDANSEGQGSEASDDEEDDEDGPGARMTVEEVLRDPLYIISIQPDIKGCIICPRKLLKNNIMASVHTTSQAHQRRMSKFKKAATSAKPDDDAQDLLSVAFASTPLQPKPPSNYSSPLSNRAAKRVANSEKMKAKRQKRKAAKARVKAVTAVKLDTEDGTDSEPSGVTRTIEPPKKKPKLERPSSLGKSVKQDIKQQPDGNPSIRRPSSPKEPQTTDAKTNFESRSTDKRKKRKERN